jgi:hypothetical protein
MNGPFRDFRLQISEVLPLADKHMFTVYHRSQYMAHENAHSFESTGMEYDLVHHFVQALCHNVDFGFTRNRLQSFLTKM